MCTSKQSQSGYSLIELVVYIALFIFLSIVITNSLLSVMRTYTTAQRYRALQNNGELIMERLTREVRNGSGTTILSECSTNPGTISISSTDTNNVAHTNIFTVSGGLALLQTDGGGTTPISTNEVTVSVLKFCRVATPTGNGIKISLTLTTTGKNPTDASFYSTALFRGL